MLTWAYGPMGTWASGVSPKRASKLQLRDVDLRFFNRQLSSIDSLHPHSPESNKSSL